MKKTLSLLALAAVLAGCSSGDNAATAKSPWSTDGNTGSSGNPIARTVATKPDTQVQQPVETRAYSWEKDKPAADEPVVPKAPEDPARAYIKEVRGDLGLVSLMRMDKPAPGDMLIVSNQKKAAKLRVVEVDGEDIIAELLPNQQDIPALTVGEEILCSIEAPPPAAE
ncbi:MAG: hypothetical protein LBV12_01695 [Puniceicoccales bacterium]|jgi:hypothetical protein|nr:hypothetical protein [Puniceicoccales bacterium]